MHLLLNDGDFPASRQPAMLVFGGVNFRSVSFLEAPTGHVPPSASPGAVSLRIVPDMEKLPEDWQQLSTPKWRELGGCRSWFR